MYFRRVNMLLSLVALLMITTAHAQFAPSGMGTASSPGTLKYAIANCIAGEGQSQFAWVGTNCMVDTNGDFVSSGGTHISDWDTSAVTTFRYLFGGYNSFNTDINNWDVSNVEDMEGMFYKLCDFNKPLDKWDVRKVTDYWEAIACSTSSTNGCGGTCAFNQDISMWNVAKATRMGHMFANAAQFKQDLSAWNVAKVNDWSNAFGGAASTSTYCGTTWVENTHYASARGSGWPTICTTKPTAGNCASSSQDYCPADATTGHGGTCMNTCSTCIGKTAAPHPDGECVVADATTCDTDNAAVANKQFCPSTASSNAGLCVANGCLDCGGHTSDADTCAVPCQPGEGRVGVVCVPCPDGQMSAYDSTCGTSCPSTYTQDAVDDKKCVFTPANKAALQAAVDACISEDSAGACPSYEPIGTWDVSQVTDMSDVFNGKAQFNQDLSAWDVSSVENFRNMFSNAYAFDQDISAWNVSSVTDMTAMFGPPVPAPPVPPPPACFVATDNPSLQTQIADVASYAGCPPNEWDVSQVTDMTEVFKDKTEFNQDLSSWDVSKVTDMTEMFKSAYAFNQDLSAWDVSSVTTMYKMFFGASAFNGDLSTWDVSQVTDMYRMFRSASAFNQDLSAWDVSQVTTMQDMFTSASAFNQDLSAWDVGRVTNMASMFLAASAFNQDLSAWNVGKVINMYGVFFQASAFNQDLSAWDVSKVTSMKYMFYMKYTASAFNQVLCGQAWRDSNADQTGMFESSSGSIAGSTCVCPYNLCLNGGTCNSGTCACASGWYDTRCSGTSPALECVAAVNSFCKDASDFGPQDKEGSYYDTVVSTWTWGDMQSRTLSGLVFAADANCPLQNFDVSQQRDMSAVFIQQDWTRFVFDGTHDITGWDTGEVRSMIHMFNQVNTFNQDISGWDVSKVEYMNYMFREATAFNQDISAWDVSNVVSMVHMFSSANTVGLALDGQAWVNSGATQTDMFHSSQWSIAGTAVDCPYNLCMNDGTCNSGTCACASGTCGTRCQNVERVPLECVAAVKSFCKDASDFGPQDQEGAVYDAQGGYGHATPMGSTELHNAVFAVSSACGLDQFDVSGQRDMTGLFLGRNPDNSFNPYDWSVDANLKDITEWDVSEVRSMKTMFAYNDFNQDISSWDVSKVYTMNQMFYDSEFNQDISAWDVSSVQNFGAMFQSANQGLVLDGAAWVDSSTAPTSWHNTQWSIAGTAVDCPYNLCMNGGTCNSGTCACASGTCGTRCQNVEVSPAAPAAPAACFVATDNPSLQTQIADVASYAGCPPNEWDVSQVTDMTEVFKDKTEFNQDLNGWNVSQVTNMQSMFQSASAFNQNLSAWDVSQVTNMQSMFQSASAFNQDLSAWDVSQVTNMYGMFRWASAFNQDLSAWDVGQVINMNQIFRSAEAFNQDISAWNVSRVTIMTSMFYQAPAFNQDLSAWNVGQVTKMNTMFYEASAFNQDLSMWDVSKVTTMGYMFYGASAFNKALCGDAWVDSGATQTAMFTGSSGSIAGTACDCPYNLCLNGGTCNSGTCACASGWNGARCNTPSGVAFSHDLSAWDVSKVTDMSGMFRQASTFNHSLCGQDWVNSSATQTDMFTGAGASAGIADTACDCPHNLCLDQTHSTGGTCSAGECTCPAPIEGDRCQILFCPAGTQRVGMACVACPDGQMSAYGSMCRASCPANYAPSAQDIKKCVCPAGEEQDGTTCVVCPDGEMSTYGSTCGGSCPDSHKLVGKACIPLCPPGEQHVYGACVGCPDGELSSYDSACGASCSGPAGHSGGLTPVGKKCVFVAADKSDLVSEINGCLGENSAGACPSYEPIRYWDVSQVTDMEDLFYNKYDFNQPLNDWNVSQVTDMSRMFFYCAYFNQPLPDWDTGKVTDMYYMFGKAWRFNEDVDNWNVANVEYMHGMFYGGGSNFRKPAGGAEFNRDISRWNVNKVLNIGYMFQKQPNMQKDLSSWNVRSDVSVDDGTFDMYTTELCGIAWSEVVDNSVSSNRCATPPDEATCVAGGLNFCPRDGATGEGGTCKGCEGCVDKPNITWTGTCRPAPEGRCDIRKMGDVTCNTNKNYIKCGQQSEADCESFGNECCIWVDTADSIAKEPGVCVWKVGFNNQLDGVCAQTQANSQYSLETILIGQSGLFADLPNGPASSKLLSQCTGGNTTCLGEYGCEHTTSGVLGGGYGDAEGDCMVWENEENCQGSYFCPNYGCVSTCEDCCDYPINGSRITCAATCQEGYNVQDGECTECETGFTRAAGDDPTAGNTVCWKYLANVNGKDFYEFDGSNKGSQNMCADIDSDFVSPTLYSECLSAKALNTGLSENYHNPMTAPDTSKSGTAANQRNNWPYPCPVQDEKFVINLEGATSCTACTGLAHPSINPICVKASMDRTGLFQALQDCVGCCQRACSAVSPLDTASGIDAGTLGSAECDAANAFCDAADGMYNDWTDGDGASCGALDTSEVRSLHYLFYRAETMDVNISGWDVSKVTNGRSTFFRAASFNQDISSWSTSNFLTMRSMFHRASSFNQPLSAWDVTSVVDMQDMFRGATSFNQDISTWDVSYVTNMNAMFREATAFNQDISVWDVSRVTNMEAMFHSATAFNQGLQDWDVREVTNAAHMFYAATAFNQDLSPWNVIKVTDTAYMFSLATAFAYDLSAWNVANVNTMDNMFQNAGYAFTLCGTAWTNSNASQVDFGTAISGPCPDNCPYNLCLNSTHNNEGVCSDGTCTCPIPWEGERCGVRCTQHRYKFENGCDECVPGYAKTGGTCRIASEPIEQFLETFKAGKVKAERAKAVREAVRPMRDPKKSLKENVVSVPIEPEDLSDEQDTLIQEMQAEIGGTVVLEMSIAAEQTVPFENPSADECTFDLNDQEAGKKTVVHAYDVGNYVYICDTTSGEMTFVAEVKEMVSGSEVKCRNESTWDPVIVKDVGESITCGGVPILIGSITPKCGPGLGCCPNDCENGDCINHVCVCVEGWEGDRCQQSTECAKITNAAIYQEKGCCDC